MYIPTFPAHLPTFYICTSPTYRYLDDLLLYPRTTVPRPTNHPTRPVNNPQHHAQRINTPHHLHPPVDRDIKTAGPPLAQETRTKRNNCNAVFYPASRLWTGIAVCATNTPAGMYVYILANINMCDTYIHMLEYDSTHVEVSYMGLGCHLCTCFTLEWIGSAAAGDLAAVALGCIHWLRVA